MYIVCDVECDKSLVLWEGQLATRAKITKAAQTAVFINWESNTTSMGSEKDSHRWSMTIEAAADLTALMLVSKRVYTDHNYALMRQLKELEEHVRDLKTTLGTFQPDRQSLSENA